MVPFNDDSPCSGWAHRVVVSSRVRPQGQEGVVSSPSPRPFPSPRPWAHLPLPAFSQSSWNILRYSRLRPARAVSSSSWLRVSFNCVSRVIFVCNCPLSSSITFCSDECIARSLDISFKYGVATIISLTRRSLSALALELSSSSVTRVKSFWDISWDCCEVRVNLANLRISSKCHYTLP